MLHKPRSSRQTILFTQNGVLPAKNSLVSTGIASYSLASARSARDKGAIHQRTLAQDREGSKGQSLDETALHWKTYGAKKTPAESGYSER